MANPKKNSKPEKKGQDKKAENLPKGLGFPKIDENTKKEIEAIKQKVEKFKDKVIEKFDKYIKGVSILPPEKGNIKDISVLVLVDDSDTKKMGKDELHGRLSQIIESVAKTVDKAIKPEVMILSDLKEACYDGKYEILKMISLSAPVYDPADLLAALRVSEIHKTMVLKKFEKYILSYVAAGSLFRGEKSFDIDVYIVIDDTDVKKMSRVELKERLRSIIISMGFEAAKIANVKKQFHIQTYILTDFWESIKDANPVIFTFLRDGVPLYDRGMFMAWKLLLRMGRIKPSSEAIEMNMEIGEKLLVRVKHKMLSVVAEDLYYAVLNPAQAALMQYGLPPPTPRDTIKLLKEIFVKKENLLEEKYVDVLERAFKMYKKIEHGELSEVSGKEIDELFKDAQDYMKRIKKLFKQIDEKTQKESVIDIYDGCINVVKDYLFNMGYKNVKVGDLEKYFKEVLVDEEGVSVKLFNIFKSVLKAKADYEKNKLSRQEINKVKKDGRRLIKDLVESLQKKKLTLIERRKVKFIYGDKVGEIVLLKDKAFVTKALDKRDEILVAKVTEDGDLSDIKPAKVEEMEKEVAKVKEDLGKVKINEKIFARIKELVGKDIEILINY